MIIDIGILYTAPPSSASGSWITELLNVDTLIFLSFLEQFLHAFTVTYEFKTHVALVVGSQRSQSGEVS